jgi:predicted ATPase
METEMQFSHVHLENWRNFLHADVALPERAFLVGANAVGKSNFLDVFRFLRDLVSPGGGFQRAVIDRGGVSRIRCLAARQNSDTAIEVVLQEKGLAAWRYRIAYAQDRGRPILKAERVWRGEELILSRPDEAEWADPDRLRQTNLEQTIANRDYRDIAEFFALVHYYHIVPQLVLDPDRSIDKRADPYGGDFLEQIAATHKNTQAARLHRILAALRVAVPQLGELKLQKDERGAPHLYGNYEHWRPQGAWQTEADFSDGTLRLAGLLWALLDGDGPLLLEEPELSLHPGIVSHVPQMMLRVQRDRKRAPRQTFLSTHSSDLLRDEGIAPDEILLFVPSQEGTAIQIGADIAEVRQLPEAGLTAADAAIPYAQPGIAAQLALF